MCDFDEAQMNSLAKKVADELAEKREKRTRLTEEEAKEIKHMLATKRWAVRVILWMFGATVLWALKDVYVYLKDHLGIVWGS